MNKTAAWASNTRVHSAPPPPTPLPSGGGGARGDDDQYDEKAALIRQEQDDKMQRMGNQIESNHDQILEREDAIKDIESTM